MNDLASRDGYRAAEEEAEWRDRAWHEPRRRYGEPMPSRKTVTWREYLTLPEREPRRCAVTGCGRVGIVYVNPWAFVCVDCHRALRARTCNETEVDDE